MRSRGAPWAHWARAASSGAQPLRVLKANRDWAEGRAWPVGLTSVKLMVRQLEVIIAAYKRRFKLTLFTERRSQEGSR